MGSEPMNWEVTVTRNGESVVTLGSNHLSGRDLSADDETAIRTAAAHLLSFAGVPPPAAAREADDAIADLLKLIHGFVTGDGQQLENLDFDEAYWRGLANDDHFDVSIHVENWLAMLCAINLLKSPPTAAETGKASEHE